MAIRIVRGGKSAIGEKRTRSSARSASIASTAGAFMIEAARVGIDSGRGAARQFPATPRSGS